MLKIFPFQYIVLIFCLSFVNKGEAQDFIFPKYQVKGKVVRVYEAESSVFERENVWDFKVQESPMGNVVELNEDGYYVSYSNYYKAGNLMYYAQFDTGEKGGFNTGGIYDSRDIKWTSISVEKGKNGRINAISFIDDNKNKVTKKYEYIYKRGKHIKTVVRISGEKILEIVFEIAGGKIKENYHLDDSGEKQNPTYFYYNKQGDPVKIETTSKDGKIQERLTYLYKYDEKGNWIKRLETNTGKDTKTLIKRTLVYADEISNTNISKEALEGYWIGWNNRVAFEFQNGKVKGRDKDKKSNFDNEYSYNPYSGELTFKRTKWERAQNFLAGFDGKILTLKSFDSGNEYLLHRINFEDLPLRDRKAFSYYTQKKPDATPFREEGSSGLKDKQGKVLIKAEYEDIYPLNAKLVKAKRNEKWGIIDYEGNPVSDFIYSELRVLKLGYIGFTKDGKKGLFSPEGKKLLAAEFGRLGVTERGFIIVEKEGRKGVYDAEGEELLPAEYRDFRDFRFNRSFAYRGGFPVRNDWVNDNYEIVKTFDQYVQVYPVDVNCFKMHGEQGWGLMDSLGNVILKPQYDRIDNAGSELVIVKKGKFFGLRNIRGEQLTPVIYDKIVTPYTTKLNLSLSNVMDEYYAAVMFLKNNRFGFLDGFGKEMAPRVNPRGIKDPFLELYEAPGQYSFSKPKYWKQSGNTFRSYDEDANASLRFKKLTYSGDPIEWAKTKTGNPSLESIMVNGEVAYVSTSLDVQGYNKYWKQEACIPINETEMLVLTFLCKEFRYPEFAQQFFEILHSVKLL